MKSYGDNYPIFKLKKNQAHLDNELSNKVKECDEEIKKNRKRVKEMYNSWGEQSPLEEA